MKALKNLLSVQDLSPERATALLDTAFSLKATWDQGGRSSRTLGGKVVAMIFEKPSLRTKVAFEVAASSLGGTPVFLSSSMILASGGNEHGRESVPDIARNLERFGDLIIARVYHHSTVQEIARSVRIPVINALCDSHHPTQALADAMAIIWKRGSLKGQTISFVGDGNNVAISLMEICSLFGAHFRIASPTGFEIDPTLRTFALVNSERNGGSIVFSNDPEEVVANADVVYTDTFISMGQESEKSLRLEAFKGYQVNEALFKKAKADALFMHCLPAHRGEEVTDHVMDCSQSIVFDQAECRLHIARALLFTMLCSPEVSASRLPG